MSFQLLSTKVEHSPMNYVGQRCQQQPYPDVFASVHVVRSGKDLVARLAHAVNGQAPLHETPQIDESSTTRSYMAGLGRWISRVGFEEQALGEYPYGYAMNNPVNYIDPGGNSPCLQPDDSCATFPGGPCAYALYAGDDRGHEGGIVCCKGKKYVCIWKPNLPPHATAPIIECIRMHERTHVPQVTCPPSGYGRPEFSPGENGTQDECKAYAIEIACYIKSMKRECGKLSKDKKKRCEDNYHWYICNNACCIMKLTYKCAPSMIPSICNSCSCGPGSRR